MSHGAARGVSGEPVRQVPLYVPGRQLQEGVLDSSPLGAAAQDSHPQVQGV